MGTDLLDKITDGLDIRTKVHKEWLTNNLLFFCTSVEISFECGRTGRASLLFNRKILLFLLFFCLKQKTLLYRRHTSRSEGFSGLADIEFDDVFGEGSGTHE